MMNEKDDDQLDESVLRHEFEMMDTSGDGSLDAEELAAVFKKLGKNVKKGTINNLVRLADEDGNGTIEWEEFAKIFEVVRSFKTSQQENHPKNPKPESETV